MAGLGTKNSGTWSSRLAWPRDTSLPSKRRGGEEQIREVGGSRLSCATDQEDRPGDCVQCSLSFSLSFAE